MIKKNNRLKSALFLAAAVSGAAAALIHRQTTADSAQALKILSADNSCFRLKKSAEPCAAVQETQSSFKDAFPEAWNHGIQKAEKLLPRLLGFGISLDKARFAAAIVFPELTKHEPLQNLCELTAVKISAGWNTPLDYSVGIFQMKSSFAESIERSLLSYRDIAENYAAIDFSGAKTEPKDRKLRAARLADGEMQILYLLAFCDIFAAMHKEDTPAWTENGNSLYKSEHCVRLFATAYNTGYHQSEAALRQLMKEQSFIPDRKTRKRRNYADIAAEWWNNSQRSAE
ncbi:MAG: hypothetical protein NC041_02010 [Bacteroides sp.]|nr:hypothetical protein [Prevotella sp.]MCM1407623.1 hypothetical protein [Treponema brennaborense]MCM1469227.1 hypothetical protein [Bacteroides sp.]